MSGSGNRQVPSWVPGNCLQVTHRLRCALCTFFTGMLPQASPRAFCVALQGMLPVQDILAWSSCCDLQPRHPLVCPVYAPGEFLHP